MHVIDEETSASRVAWVQALLWPQAAWPQTVEAVLCAASVQRFLRSRMRIRRGQRWPGAALVTAKPLLWHVSTGKSSRPIMLTSVFPFLIFFQLLELMFIFRNHDWEIHLKTVFLFCDINFYWRNKIFCSPHACYPLPTTIKGGIDLPCRWQCFLLIWVWRVTVLGCLCLSVPRKTGGRCSQSRDSAYKWCWLSLQGDTNLMCSSRASLGKGVPVTLTLK